MTHFRILGPLEVANDDGLVDLGGEQQRSLLAVLLLRVNEIVPNDSLVEAIWEVKPPRTAIAGLQNRIAQLRKLLGDASIETRPPGYLLRATQEQLDVGRFEQLERLADGKPAPERAEILSGALALWRGEPLADLRFKSFAQDEIRRLADARLRVRGKRIDADLECGRHADVVAELEQLARAHPMDNKHCERLMLALYRCGRQGDAVRAFQAARNALDELGQLPGPELLAAHRAILQHRVAVTPTARRRRPFDDTYDDIVRAALSSQLVVVLGPHADGPESPGPAAAARHLAHRFGCPPEYDGSLTRVSQWVAVTQGVGPLYEELRGLYERNDPPGAIHRSLVALAPLLRARGRGFQLLLTSGFDHMLERAYADAGEEYDVVSFVSLGRDRGRFLHIAADGASRLIDEPNREVGLTSEKRTVIVRLNGGADELSSPGRDSYVVSEDDYIDYLSQSKLSELLPVDLAARLRRSHLLFVGYDLEDWSPRVFLRRLWGEEPIFFKSWAIAQTPNRLTAEHWRQLGVDILDAPSHESLHELHQRIERELADGTVS